MVGSCYSFVKSFLLADYFFVQGKRLKKREIAQEISGYGTQADWLNSLDVSGWSCLQEYSDAEKECSSNQ
jgi:hypothetical protein